MPALVAYLVLFTLIGFIFVFFHLVVGKLVRPAKPNPEKLAIYECGEPTIGSSWIQFDLRFYVVALLFVIFDVEVAFFFPWAVVYGKLNTLGNPTLTKEDRVAVTNALMPPVPDPVLARTPDQREHQERLARDRQLMLDRLALGDEQAVRDNRAAALHYAWIAFVDILVFFGVLLVGFAYLWRRGDLDWVRSTAAERAKSDSAARPPPAVTQPELVEAR